MTRLNVIKPDGLSSEDGIILAMEEAKCSFGLCNDSEQGVLALDFPGDIDRDEVLKKLQSLGFTEVPSLMRRVATKVRSLLGGNQN